MQKALDYLDLVKEHLPATKLWDILLMTARAGVLVQGGEFEEGVALATSAATICHTSGNYRFLDRLYGIQRHLDQLTQQIGQAGSLLREALDGPAGY